MRPEFFAHLHTGPGGDGGTASNELTVIRIKPATMLPSKQDHLRHMRKGWKVDRGQSFR